MTTRRDVLTGLAALPIAAAGSAAKAAAVPPVVRSEPAPPPFIHDVDRQLAREIDTMEQLLAAMKDRLAVANNPNPMIRSGALLEMRCSFTAFCITTDFARRAVEMQRLHAENAVQFKKFQRNLTAYYDACAAEPVA